MRSSPESRKKTKNTRNKAPSGLPADLSLQEILELPEEGFKELAQKLNTEPEKLRQTLSKATERLKMSEEIRQNAPSPRYERDPNEAAIHAAFEEVMKEFEFLEGPYSPERIEILKEKVDQSIRIKLEVRGEKAVLNDARAMRAYRRVYTIEAFSKFTQPSDSKNTQIKYADAIHYLQEKLKGINLSIEREGIQGAIKILEEMKNPEKRAAYETFHKLYIAYRRANGVLENLSSSEQNTLLRLFQDVRARARTGKSPYSKWARFSIDEMIDILAANLLAMRPYFLKGSEGYSYTRSGWEEKFGVPGSEIGGQFGYNFQARRPRRYNDEGNHGN